MAGEDGWNNNITTDEKLEYITGQFHMRKVKMCLKVSQDLETTLA